ncbi:MULTISPECIES: MFS transporter [unclassified Roseovarius]|uniref:MFS transporter n=1 Tax=unclassified Roseovarius TaxID=2614913 RepID=UPI00273EC194|nr:MULTISPECIES: MFS transporter [unclassified Roseovarius]
MVEAVTVEERNVLKSVAVLTFSAGFVAQFFAQGVSLFLRDAGVASNVIGLIYLAAIPYTLRFVWAPLIDRSSLGGRGRFDRWILVSNAALCLLLVVLAVLKPSEQALLIILVVGAAMLVLGTLQTALGGLLVEGLSATLYPRGASLQAATSAAAGMVLGGCVLYLIGPLGWGPVVWALFTVCLAITVLAALALTLDHNATASRGKQPRLWDQFSVFKDARARRLLLVSVSVSAAVVIPYASKSVLLIDAGFSISDSGLIGIVAGNAAGFCGALLVRPLIERKGGYFALTLLAGLNVTVVICLILSLGTEPGAAAIVTLVLFANFSVFAAYTAGRSVLMPLCSPGQQATQLASFVGVEAVLYLIIAGAGVSSLDKVGLIPLLSVGAGLSLVGCLLASRARDRPTVVAS